MKNKIAIIGVFFAVLLIGFTSCGMIESNTARTTSFSPDVVRLDVNLGDFKLLGEVEVSAEYRSYLGFIWVLDRVNEELYDSRNQKIVNIAGQSDLRLHGYIKKALYKAVEKYPNADYYMPVMSKKSRENLFLGSGTKHTVVIKAYKFAK